MVEITVGISAATLFIVVGAIWNFSGRFSVMESRVKDMWEDFCNGKKSHSASAD